VAFSDRFEQFEVCRWPLHSASVAQALTDHVDELVANAVVLVVASLLVMQAA